MYCKYVTPSKPPFKLQNNLYFGMEGYNDFDEFLYDFIIKNHVFLIKQLFFSGIEGYNDFDEFLYNFVIKNHVFLIKQLFFKIM